MLKRISFIITLSCLFILFVNKVVAQPAWSIRLRDSVDNKPAKFEDHKLGSEVATEKKFTTFRRFKQNVVTHYNYYYNANNKVKAIVEKAEIAQKDNYDKLLSFYPYSLDNTASQKKDLDSVILKCTAGILLHDLRNDWIDNMYLLIGEAYFFRKDFDSAAGTFQFINYNLFPRQKDEDDNRVVGTNSDASKSTISIANPEKQNFVQKIVSQPPSRNDALLWMIRTLIEQNEYGESSGLINTLQTDPNLPPRLRDDLEEVDAYWFFRQQIYDSAATHLEKALTNADSKEDKARSEYLLAQLYEMEHQFSKASQYYDIASKNTTDPLMDIHAQLNNAKMLRTDKPEELDIAINNLLHMANKDKFEMYKGILFYSAAQLAMQKPDTTAAILYDKKCIASSANDIITKNKAFIQLGDIAYDRKQYKESFSDYDSLQSGDTTLGDRLQQIQARRNSLSKIVEKINIIDREDSLQMVAEMPEAERDAFVKKLSRELLKQKGSADDDNSTGLADDNPFATKNQSPVLFNDNTSGDWYFYNTSLRTKGFTDFKTKWGKRTNADNWSRASAVAAPTVVADISPSSMNPDAIDTTTSVDSAGKMAAIQAIDQPKDLTFVGLMSGLPLTQKKLDESNSLIAINLFELANLYKDDLEDYEQALVTYRQSLLRFPDSLYDGQLYLGLYYCYSKLGDTVWTGYYKNLLIVQFPKSHSTEVLTNPELLSVKDTIATKRYENIYNLFIEGEFDQAVEEKKKADSLYGNSYWSPQLLYIEAVYYIKVCTDDSTAKVVLKNLIRLYPSSPMKPKAQRMIEVLNRRASIEAYLTKLKVTRAKDDEVVVTHDEPTVTQNLLIITKPAKTDSSKMANKNAIDSVRKITNSVGVVRGPYTFDSTQMQNVVMWLNKVDPTYVNEAVNALKRYNGENYSGQQFLISKAPFDSGQVLLVISIFANDNAALQYYYKFKKAASTEVSWLPANKYSFLIISNDNLQILKTNKDLNGYKKLLNLQYPNKF